MAKRTRASVDPKRLGFITDTESGELSNAYTELMARFALYPHDGCTVLRFLAGPVGLTRQLICDEIGVSTSALGHFLKGRAPMPLERRKELLDVLEKMLGILRESCLPLNEDLVKAEPAAVILKPMVDALGPDAVAPLQAQHDHQRSIAQVYAPLVRQLIEAGEKLAQIEAGELEAADTK